MRAETGFGRFIDIGASGRITKTPRPEGRGEISTG
jgi:hypothetical protein